MLYSEFINGTNCKDNAINYKIYKDLEIMYMNSDMSKAEIYAYGKKLVDNSKTEKELEIEKELNNEIADIKKDIEYLKEEKEYRIAIDDKTMVKILKQRIKEKRMRIKEIKWILG